jgi:hypothetical protein
MAGKVRVANHESASFSQEDLQKLQDRAPPARCLRHLLGPAAQAASGLRRELDDF